MKHYIPVLSIAGSDCSGGAGIQADLKAISALGSYAATAITAVTVQNTCGVRAIHPVPADIIKGQIQAVMEDIRPLAVKIGMVNDIEAIHAIAEALTIYHPLYVVFDPVMVSTSGHRLIEEEAIELLKTTLIPLATVITPNLKEAEVLYGKPISTLTDMEKAADELLCLGCQSVLIKGGHLEGNEMTDILLTGKDASPLHYPGTKVDSHNTHGTGCTLSSAIATFLAQGYALPEAVKKAKDYVYNGILHGKDIQIGDGHGPLNHFFSPISMKIKE